MALKAGRVGVAQDQVDLFGNIIGSGDSYTKTEADEKFLSKSDATSTYYTKDDIDSKLEVVVKYAGKKTFLQLTSDLLVSTYENNFFMLSDSGYIDSSNIDNWNDNYVVGDHVLVDSHIAVIAYTGSDPNKGAYVFDDFGGFVEVDEYTTAVTQASGKVTFSNLNPAYGYEINVVIPDEVGILPTAATALTIPKYTGIKRSTNADGTINLEYSVTGIDGSTQYKLRIFK